MTVEAEPRPLARRPRVGAQDAPSRAITPVGPTRDVPRRKVARRPTLRPRLGLLTSSLTRHILAINILVLAVPIGGVFYLDQYQSSLIAAEMDGLRVQGEIFSGALGAGAVVNIAGLGQQIDPDSAQALLRRLVEPTGTRARLFGPDGSLLVDSRDLAGATGDVQVEDLPPLDSESEMLRWLVESVNAVINWVPGLGDLTPYRERPDQSAYDYPEARDALGGDSVGVIRGDGDRGIILTAAVPVQRYKQVLGVVLLSTTAANIEGNLRAVRLDILKVFGIALTVTVALSLYLGGTIARPLRRLALVAQRVRRDKSRQVRIPDLRNRGDEIGELSASLREMTEALWARMDAIEGFAADVAHEIKNPLTSLRSAVETVARVSDVSQQRRLMAIILEDVHRMDRLISDISEASRLDAELSRNAPERVALSSLLGALVEMEQANAAKRQIALVVSVPPGPPIYVHGYDARLGQVYRNVIQNAVSFSPTDGRVAVNVVGVGEWVRTTIDDGGPGIREGKLEAIFERFYSDRPDDQAAKFGNHSGLGLSISRQIVQACGGEIWAENRRDANGNVVGARFVIELRASTN